MADAPPAATTRRRNGTIASCEPCRKRKTRCDHVQPVCHSCQQRGLDSSCFYRPSPLTKKTRMNQRGNLAAVDDHTLSQTSTSSTATNRLSDNLDIHVSLAQASAEHTIETTAYRFKPCPKAIHREQVASVAKALGCLRDCEFICNLVTTYYSASQAAVIPSPLISSSLPALRDTIKKFVLFNDAADNDTQLLRLSEAVLCSTSARINIDDSLTPSTFMGLYTGDHLRLEYLGIVFSIAARSCLIGLARDGRQHDAFLRDMFSYSTFYLRLAREITPINDMLVWFGHDHLMLTACIEGSSNSKWPLDLTDAEVLADPAELAEAHTKLALDGWNTEGKFCASSWARVRCITAEMLEEIYKYKFCPMTVENITKLKDISKRNWEIWKTIPSHLHYNTRCWTSELHPQICFMLIVVLLAFLQCDFQIFRILEQSDPQSTQKLLKISVEMISLIHELGSFRRKAVYLHLRFSYIILCYGLSPAMVLAKAAQSLAGGIPHASLLPPELDRSRLIRTLSVFISQLESISGPGEPNYDICVQACTTITKMLDELLNLPPAHLRPAARTGSPAAQLANLDDTALSIIGAGEANANDWGDIDFSNWASSIDWTAVCGEWSVS